MIVGSEGTLAVVTEAKVRLAPIPKAKGVAALHFPTVASACRATMAALEHGPSSVEIVGSTIIERCRESVGYARLVDFVIGDPGALLLVEMYGDTPEQVAASLARLTEDFAARGLTRDVVLALDAGSQARMWRMREAGLGLLMSVRGDAKPVAFVEDPAVPPERLGDFIEAFDALVRRHSTESAYYGHASVGCMHLRPMANIKDAAGLASMEAIAIEVADLVLQFGGSLSGEHGDGILRGVFTERMFGARLTEAFREVKRTFDPLGILNPGKIVDTPAFSDNLRLSPTTHSLQPPTLLDWSHEQGFARAAVRVLETLGYRVRVVVQVACCGRTLLSSGQLAAARDLARANIELLRGYATAGIPIVGTEPSCLLALRDEYVSLVPTEDARAVASVAVLLDELVARLAAEDPRVASLFRPIERPALLHAHCHQKAIVGAEPTLAALALVPGLSTTLVDSACCGMAGSFGFESEHYDVSRAMAMRSLIPAVDGSPANAEVLVTGISCRQQIEHFSTRRPRHTAELLAEALKG